MISAKDRFIQVKFLHRVYYMPQRLSVIYPTLDALCPSCRGEVENLIHMVWSSLSFQSFWQAVVADIKVISGVSLTLDSLVLLLRMTYNIPTNMHVKLFMFYAAYYARKTILFVWKASNPPMVSTWENNDKRYPATVP